MYMTVILSVLCNYLVYGYGAWATNHIVKMLTYITRVHAQPNKRICIKLYKCYISPRDCGLEKSIRKEKRLSFPKPKTKKSKE